MKEELLQLGFEIAGTGIMDSIRYTIISKHKKTRALIISNLSNPNEMISFAEYKPRTLIVEDLVVLHNYDYDGYITLDRIKSLMFGLTGEEKFNIRYEKKI